MAKLIWDAVGDRSFRSGLDHGVLYLKDSYGVPWNGLTEIKTSTNNSITSVYYDGIKVNHVVNTGELTGSIKAITYPEEFENVSGSDNLRSGVIFDSQRPETFSIAYRTIEGNDVDGEDASYKIHIIWDMIAQPASHEYKTRSTSVNIETFDWSFMTMPSDIDGFYPSGHVILESKNIDPWLLKDVEDILFGTDDTEPVLPSMTDLVSFMDAWCRVYITVHDDGTWTASSSHPGFIFINEDGTFSLENINAYYLDDGTFVITDTKDHTEVGQLVIHDHGDGKWTAYSHSDSVIEIALDGTFQIHDVEPTYISEDEYQISNVKGGYPRRKKWQQ